METVVLGGGCFWCLDALYRRVVGVERSVCGYAGGEVADPSYELVCTGTTGHAEVVRLTYDPAVIPTDTVLDIYFATHNPTTLNRQGADVGTQYRSIMLYSGPEQQEAFTQAAKRAEQIWGPGIVTRIEPLDVFYPAEDYHQDYFAHHPESGYCQAVISPKLAKARSAFSEWFV